MIPTDYQIKKLWDVYHLPSYKRNHCEVVAKLAVWFVRRLKAKRGVSIDVKLLKAGALLHDIDKMAPKLAGEHHPDTGVRILREHGFGEVADLVKTHPLHAILDQSIAPKTIEQKLLYVSDKMVKHTIITVDERFALWRKERWSEEARDILEASYPKVKEIEKEICALAGVAPGENLSIMEV